ncbi:MAG TPA: hypothetical protein VF655_08300 [Allosphingosinicella sp.]|jgi:hypothetical protein
MTATANKQGKGRQALKLLIGAAAGALSTIAFMEFVGKSRLDSGDPGVAIAIVAGLIYFVMGLGVGVGALAPRQGAVFLNVEDAEELREQRASLGPSAISCILMGAFLLLLALAPVEKGGDLTIWAVAAGACLIGGVAIARATRRRADELMRQVSLESSALTLNLALAGLSAWALLAHLGFVRWATPLGLIAGLALLHLGAIFWTAARKGMMKPR